MFSVHQKVFFKKHTEKVAVNTVVGLLYKVLKNCLLQACDVFDVKMIQIWTFPAAPSTERVPSLAERVAYLDTQLTSDYNLFFSKIQIRSQFEQISTR